LRDRGFAVGRIARVAKRGGIALGYFFGPRRPHPPTLQELAGLQPDQAMAVVQFGDLSIRNGDWPVLGHRDQWNRAMWPMPDFGRYVEFDGRAWRVQYPDDDPNGVPRETPISVEECRRLPEDGLLGAGAVELLLTRLLGRVTAGNADQDRDQNQDHVSA
jgi:hypothetical protein